jgi:hypothetical protein
MPWWETRVVSPTHASTIVAQPGGYPQITCPGQFGLPFAMDLPPSVLLALTFPHAGNTVEKIDFLDHHIDH